MLMIKMRLLFVEFLFIRLNKLSFNRFLNKLILVNVLFLRILFFQCINKILLYIILFINFLLITCMNKCYGFQKCLVMVLSLMVLNLILLALNICKYWNMFGIIVFIYKNRLLFLGLILIIIVMLIFGFQVLFNLILKIEDKFLLLNFARVLKILQFL